MLLLNRTQNKTQNGFSLVELMISMSVGILLTSGVISMFTGSLKNSYEFVSLAKLDQDLQGVMDLVSKEVRRAGYDANTAVGNDTDFGINTDSTSTCLLYSYDSNSTGTVGELDDTEQYGIRFDRDTNKVLFGSSVTACSGTGWTSINDTNSVQVTNLSFSQNNICLNLTDNSDCATENIASGDQVLWKKQINIVISGNFTNDSSNYTHSIENTVRLHNDILQVSP